MVLSCDLAHTDGRRESRSLVGIVAKALEMRVLLCQEWGRAIAQLHDVDWLMIGRGRFRRYAHDTYFVQISANSTCRALHTGTAVSTRVASDLARTTNEVLPDLRLSFST